MPTKAIGPQKAVISPARRAVITINMSRTHLILMPRVVAASSPSTSALRGRMEISERSIPKRNSVPIKGRWWNSVSCNEPIPHIMKPLTLSAVLMVCTTEVNAEVKLPIMIPTRSRLTLFLTKPETPSISSPDSKAPMKARNTVLNSKEKNEKPDRIPVATARLAPELIPRIYGPARGFRKSVCISIPHTASAEPEKMAIAVLGILNSRAKMC